MTTAKTAEEIFPFSDYVNGNVNYEEIIARMEQYASQFQSSTGYTAEEIRQAGRDGEVNSIDVDHLIGVLKRTDAIKGLSSTENVEALAEEIITKRAISFLLTPVSKRMLIKAMVEMYQMGAKVNNVAPLRELKESVSDEVQAFYKVKGKFSNKADLIRGVIAKTLSVVETNLSPSNVASPIAKEVCDCSIQFKAAHGNCYYCPNNKVSNQ